MRHMFPVQLWPGIQQPIQNISHVQYNQTSQRLNGAVSHDLIEKGHAVNAVNQSICIAILSASKEFLSL